MLKYLRLLSAILLISVMLINTPAMAAEDTKPSPANSNFKAWMDYRACRPSSAQGKLQGIATTDANGIRTVNGRYCVALGTYYSKIIGTKCDVTLSTGKVLPCILGDVKADKHTDATNRQSNSGNGNVVEFIVDKKRLPQCVKSSGSIHSIPGFEGDVVSITVYTDDESEEHLIVPGETVDTKATTVSVSSNKTTTSSNEMDKMVLSNNTSISSNKVGTRSDEDEVESAKVGRVDVSYNAVKEMFNRDDEDAVESDIVEYVTELNDED